MRFLIGLSCIIAGMAIWALAITVVAAWWAFCFGTVIVGVLLLFFMPYVLVAPLVISRPGTFLIYHGLAIIYGRELEPQE